MWGAWGELGEELSRFYLNLRLGRGIRSKESLTLDGFSFRAARQSDLKELQELHLKLFGGPMVRWIRWVYRLRAPELVSVLRDATGQLIGYDCFMFNEVEVEARIIHEQYLGIAPEYQGRGLSVQLRRYSLNCYAQGTLRGASTLARETDLKALRSAQKAGYAITRMSAKPPAYYLYQSLSERVRVPSG